MKNCSIEIIIKASQPLYFAQCSERQMVYSFLIQCSEPLPRVQEMPASFVLPSLQRERKVKCDRTMPAFSRCQRDGCSCTYSKDLLQWQE
jgi:hypothetical protein